MGCCGAQPVDGWAHTTHNPNSHTTGSPRMEPWTDGEIGEPLILTSDLLRNPCSVNCHASHACGAALSFCSWPLCRESGFAMRLHLPGSGSLAMCLLKPSSLPQCVFAMRLRPSNVSLQCDCVTQCIFAMRLRHPVRPHNASAPPKAPAPSNASSPKASSECVCVCAY